MPHTLAPVARDLTPAEAEERRASCDRLDGQIKTALAVGRAAAWELSRRLHEFHEEHGWSAVGFDKLKDWLAQPDVDITESAYHAAVDRWEQIVVLRRVDSGRLESLAPTKVDLVLPKLKAGHVQLEPALEDAATLPQRKLKDLYRAPVDRSPARKPPPDDDQPAYDGFDDLEPPPDDQVELPPDDSPFVATEPATVEPDATAPELTLAEAIEAARDEEVYVHGRRHDLKLALRDIIAAYDREVGARDP
jgi:hypothetical protein